MNLKLLLNLKKILLILLPILGFAQSEKNPCETLSTINTIIQNKHYKPKPVDDSLSVYVYDAFLKNIDEDNRLFTELEIDKLKQHKLQIDNYLLENNCSFLTEFYTLYSNSILRYKTIVENIKSEPFAFKSSETIEFSMNSFPYAKDEEELKKLYKKRILFQVLREISESSTNKDSIIANFSSISELSKDKIFESYLCKYSSLQMSEKEFNSKFFSVFCSYFDPHTMYLSESDKSDFFSSVSANNLSFGLNVSVNEKDEIIVDEIIPGSSAYFTEKVTAGDQVIKVKYKDEEYLIACSSISKVEAIFNSTEYKNVDFTLRKKSGEIYTVSLTKKLLKNYENKVYSYILEKDNKRAGYIRIPSFYGKFENGKTNVSEDVAKEVYKLNEDGIDGLIIDLENNGGGSMEEALKLTGSFIDSGPIAIMNDKNGKKKTVKDPIKGSIYFGPMVVLINGFSASASEFFTNTMQDYNRAIIIGNQSHGKATMQTVVPLTSDRNPKEFIKITIEEFYRITGKSNQSVGITPDVEIPTLFDKQMPRENENLTALKNKSFKSKLRYNSFFNRYNSDVITKSKKRVSSNKMLQSISELNSKIDKVYQYDLAPILLEFNAVYEEVTKMNSLWKELKEMSLKVYPIEVKRNSIDIAYQQFDDYLKSSNNEKIKAIKNNLHIIEAVNIINDLKSK